MYLNITDDALFIELKIHKKIIKIETVKIFLWFNMPHEKLNELILLLTGTTMIEIFEYTKFRAWICSKKCKTLYFKLNKFTNVINS